MFVQIILLLLPSLIFACKIDIEDFAYDTDQYRLRCVPELSKDNVAKPSTVCVVTCKSNNLRFKHRCNLNGKWDIDPDLDKCGKVVTCNEDPHEKWQQCKN